MDLLITTFNNWQILPELAAFVAPKKYDLYALQYGNTNPGRFEEIRRNREEYGIREPDEMWLICTGGVHPEHVSKWENWHADYPIVPYRRFQISGLRDIHTLEDSRRMREFILRVTWLANKRTGDKGKLFISLAGGRKTMSSDMQYAAGFFGCDALIHIAASGQLDDSVFFDYSNAVSEFDVVPFVTDSFSSHPAVDTVEYERYSIPVPPVNSFLDIECAGTPLLEKIEGLYNTSGNFYINYNEKENEKYRSNFSVLFSLPRTGFREMENEIITFETRYNDVADFLVSLPKTELHCHLGGVLYPEQILQVAQTWRSDVTDWCKISSELNELHEACSKASRNNDLDAVPPVLRDKGIKKLYSSQFAENGVPLHIVACACSLAFASNENLFEKVIYGDLLNGNSFTNIGITSYEKLGDFQGSSLLQSPESIRLTVKLMCENAVKDNVKYLELRCSPHKYTAGGLEEKEVYRLIEKSLREYSGRMKSKIIIIASRHGDEKDIQKAVELAVEVSGDQESLLAGMDLAGDEAARRPEEVRTLFLPLLEKCMGVTIHAGETMSSQSVWEAVYHLSAERIGHGLTLIERSDLMKKVTDRRIGVEMCPSSNMQIAGYSRDEKNGEGGREYPLKTYLENDLRVTVNTDNPGISLTSWSNELYKAAALSHGGLNLFQILQLVKNGVSTSFLTHEEKKKMMFKFEEDILNVVKKGVV